MDIKIVGRRNEIAQLNELYSSGNAEFGLTRKSCGDGGGGQA